MITKIYMLSFLILGLALTPNNTYACGAKSEKTCCKKKSSHKSETKSCCKKSNNNTTEEEGCGGNCGDQSCQCSGISIGFILPFIDEIRINNVDFFIEDQKFGSLKVEYSTGFSSLWTLPKIG